jgi:hypothetical protein
MFRFPFVFDAPEEKADHGSTAITTTTTISQSPLSLLSSSAVVDVPPPVYVDIGTRVIQEQQQQRGKLQIEEIMFFPDLLEEDHFGHEMVVVAQEEANKPHPTTTPAFARAGDTSSCLHEKEKANNSQQQIDQTMDTLPTFASLLSSSQHHQFLTTTTDKKKKMTKKKKRKKVGFDNDGLPKRPLSAYSLFFKAKRAEMLSPYVATTTNAKTTPQEEDVLTVVSTFTTTNVTTADNTARNALTATTSTSTTSDVPPQMLGKVIGKQWREIKSSERKLYEDLADRDCERYRREMEAAQYNYENSNKRLKKQSLQEEDSQHRSKESSTKASATFVTPSNSPSHIPKLVGVTTIPNTRAAIPTNYDTHGIEMSSLTKTGQLFSQAPQVVPLSMSSPYYQHEYDAGIAFPNTARAVSHEQHHYPFYATAPAPHPAMAVVAMPPGMEIYLTIPISNSTSGTSASHQGQELRRTPSDEIIFRNYYHHKRKQQLRQPTISDCSEAQQQQHSHRYRLVYQCYSMKRFQADKYLETFITKGMQCINKQHQQH